MDIWAEGLPIMLIVGLTAGLLAGQIVEREGFGLLGDLLIGVSGALLGGWLLPQIGMLAGPGMLAAAVNGTIGAAVLLPLAGLIRRRGGWRRTLPGWGFSDPATHGGRRSSDSGPERKS